MDMQAQEEVLMGCPNKEQAQMIVKGKRTKRQRPQSPIPFKIPPANSSKSDEAGSSSDICSNIQDTNNTDDILVSNQITSVSNALQPASSSDEYNCRDSATEEEEDMANCLILLAQGQSRQRSLSSKDQHLNQHEQAQDQIGQKFSSRKFMETGTASGSGKAGYYVYECKTCSKTFPSFQALGGHRASHKKPKVDNIRQAANFLVSDDEDSQYISSSLSLQLNNRSGLFNNSNHGSNNNYSKARVHECSVCGAEFSSGQALGGHMRRHRGPVGGGGGGSQAATTTTTTLSLTATMKVKADHADHHHQHHQMEEKRVVVPSLSLSPSTSPSSAAKNNVLSLDLDLNLPAPDDDHRESKFHFASKQPQEQQLPPLPPPPPTQQQQQQLPQQLVFSPPTLVGCHY